MKRSRKTCKCCYHLSSTSSYKYTNRRPRGSILLSHKEKNNHSPASSHESTNTGLSSEYKPVSTYAAMATHFSNRIGENEGGGRTFVSSFMSASRCFGPVEDLTTLDRVPGCRKWGHCAYFRCRRYRESWKVGKRTEKWTCW
jgi:hypothetical protein